MAKEPQWPLIPRARRVADAIMLKFLGHSLKVAAIVVPGADWLALTSQNRPNLRIDDAIVALRKIRHFQCCGIVVLGFCTIRHVIPDSRMESEVKYSVDSG